jgi:hypothetical protein
MEIYMKYLLFSVLSLCFLSACQKPAGNPPPLDGKALAERFIKPAGDQGIAGIVFNKDGNPIAITADGKIIEPCHLPSPDGAAGKPATTTASGAQIPECHGTTDTAIYNISQVTTVRHKGSTCITFAIPVDGYVSIYTYCWD